MTSPVIKLNPSQEIALLLKARGVAFSQDQDAREDANCSQGQNCAGNDENISQGQERGGDNFLQGQNCVDGANRSQDKNRAGNDNSSQGQNAAALFWRDFFPVEPLVLDKKSGHVFQKIRGGDAVPLRPLFCVLPDDFSEEEFLSVQRFDIFAPRLFPGGNRFQGQDAGGLACAEKFSRGQNRAGNEKCLQNDNARNDANRPHDKNRAGGDNYLQDKNCAGGANRSQDKNRAGDDENISQNQERGGIFYFPAAIKSARRDLHCAIPFAFRITRARDFSLENLVFAVKAICGDFSEGKIFSARGGSSDDNFLQSQNRAAGGNRSQNQDARGLACGEEFLQGQEAANNNRSRPQNQDAQGQDARGGANLSQSKNRAPAAEKAIFSPTSFLFSRAEISKNEWRLFDGVWKKLR